MLLAWRVCINWTLNQWVPGLIPIILCMEQDIERRDKGREKQEEDREKGLEDRKRERGREKEKKRGQS